MRLNLLNGARMCKCDNVSKCVRSCFKLAEFAHLAMCWSNVLCIIILKCRPLYYQVVVFKRRHDVMKIVELMIVCHIKTKFKKKKYFCYQIHASGMTIQTFLNIRVLHEISHFYHKKSHVFWYRSLLARKYCVN